MMNVFIEWVLPILITIVAVLLSIGISMLLYLAYKQIKDL